MEPPFGDLCHFFNHPTSKSKLFVSRWIPLPIASMYGILTYIYHKNQPNVGKYTIHGSYGHQGVPLQHDPLAVSSNSDVASDFLMLPGAEPNEQ